MPGIVKARHTTVCVSFQQSYHNTMKITWWQKLESDPLVFLYSLLHTLRGFRLHYDIVAIQTSPLVAIQRSRT